MRLKKGTVNISVRFILQKVTNSQLNSSLHKNCANTEFFWSVFSRIWTEYGDLRSK